MKVSWPKYKLNKLKKKKASFITNVNKAMILSIQNL